MIPLTELHIGHVLFENKSGKEGQVTRLTCSMIYLQIQSRNSKFPAQSIIRLAVAIFSRSWRSRQKREQAVKTRTTLPSNDTQMFNGQVFMKYILKDENLTRIIESLRHRISTKGIRYYLALSEYVPKIQIPAFKH